MSKFSVCVGLGAAALGVVAVAEWRMNAGLMPADAAHDYLPLFAASGSSASISAVSLTAFTATAVVRQDPITGEEVTGMPEAPQRPGRVEPKPPKTAKA